jgi:hypothetical protein
MKRTEFFQMTGSMPLQAHLTNSMKKREQSLTLGAFGTSFMRGLLDEY